MHTHLEQWTHTHTHTWSSGHTHTPGAVDTHTHMPGAVDTHTHTWSSGYTHTHTHTHTHTPGAVGSRRCGVRGAVGGSVPCSRVSPQSWTIPAGAEIRTHNRHRSVNCNLTNCTAQSEVHDHHCLCLALSVDPDHTGVTVWTPFWGMFPQQQCTKNKKSVSFTFLKFCVRRTALSKPSPFTRTCKNDKKCFIMHARPVVGDVPCTHAVSID